MHSSHAITASQALFRVFVLPALSKPAAKRCMRFEPFRSHGNQLQQHQPFSSTVRSLAKTRAPEQRAHKWNTEIQARFVYLVDPETNKLSERLTRWDVLNSIDDSTHRLEQVSADEPDNPNFIPVCKIVSKKESYEKDRRRKTAQKEAKKASLRGSEMGMKTVELNWAIDANDLGHRLGKVKSFLQEGRMVSVMLASKKGGRRATREECEGVLRRIRKTVEEVQGAQEKKQMEGRIGAIATLTFQGKVPAGNAGSEDAGAVEGDGAKQGQTHET